MGPDLDRKTRREVAAAVMMQVLVSNALEVQRKSASRKLDFNIELRGFRYSWNRPSAKGLLT